MVLSKDFKKLMTARFLFTFGAQMQTILIAWRIYELLPDPLALGFVGLTEAVPALGLALYAGHIVDRSRPLVVYRRVIFISLASALIVFISQFFRQDISVTGQAVALYCASFLTGTARSFSQPSIFAAVPRIVKRTNLALASAWLSSAGQLARIGGPALGGLFYGYLGVTQTAGVICATLFVGIIVMSSIEVLHQIIATPKQNEPISESLFKGARFVFRHPILLPALSLDMVSVLFAGVTALLPIYAKEILFVGAKGLGILRAAPALGAAIMSFYLTRINIKTHAGRWFLIAVTGFGICILTFALSRNFELSLVALALSGAFDSVSLIVRTTAVQLCSPDEIRGRISAVNSIFIGSSNEIGEFESGVTAKLLGTMPAAVFGGIMCLVTVGAVAWLSPTLRRMNLEKIEADAEAV